MRPVLLDMLPPLLIEWNSSWLLSLLLLVIEFYLVWRAMADLERFEAIVVVSVKSIIIIEYY